MPNQNELVSPRILNGEIDKIGELTDYALSEVKRKYGTGDSDGETPKKYLNLRHSREVLDAATKIAELAVKNGEITNRDIALIRISAAFHDIEQNLGGRK